MKLPEREENHEACKNNQQTEFEGNCGQRRLRRVSGVLPVGVQNLLHRGESEVREINRCDG